VKQSTQLSVGELRSDLLKLFEPESGVDVLAAAPGHIGAFPGMTSIHKSPVERVGRSDAYAFRHALFMALAREIDALPQTEEWESVIQRWCIALERSDARCWHYMRTPLFTRLISRGGSTLICPAPITAASTRHERELNVELTGAEHERAQAWFQSQVAESENISEELRTLLRESWAGPPISPTELYYKVLSQYFWATIEGLDLKADDNPLLEQLTEFQLEAYQYAKGILRRYGGVFLADVVGLGKTFIALALLRHLQDRYGEYAVVIGPPNVLPAWRALAAEFRVELQTVSIGKLEDLEMYRDREVLVIDESHNFRNAGTQRYERIQSWLRPGGVASERKVLLVSATPQNNHPNDVKHQLAFFPDNYARLPFRGESLDAWFSQVQTGQASLTELLQHVVVRRTRRFIKSAYSKATLRVRTKEGGYEHVPLQFPERRSGAEQCLRYSINDTYGGDLYQQILGVLAGLSYAPYCLATYLTDEGRTDHRVAGIRRAGTSVRGLYKVLLLKRLESSIVAFRGTLGRFLSRHDECLARLEQGIVTVRVREHATSASEDDVQDLAAEERAVPASLFETTRLRATLVADSQAVRALLDRVSDLDETKDSKVTRLCDYLQDRDPTVHRTIVFTQFADTAEYLGRALGQRFGKTEVVTGGRGNAMAITRRFSPRSNRVEVPDDEQIDLLISTDALSEGVNLQDADTLVNYDIHWNPVRLIQRAGRIDRIGSENDVIDVGSFLPEAALEAALGLETVLRRRIQEFLEVFGEDSHVLPSDDHLEPVAAVSAYTGAAFDEQDDDMDGLSRHVERLLQLRREDPEMYGRVLEIRPGRHAVSTSSELPVGGARLGWFWRFWVHDRDAKMRSVDDLRGLDVLFAHAESGECKDAPSHVRRELGEFIGQIREAFEPMAESFREQRLRPRLSPPESFVLERLEGYKRTCVVSRRDHVDELIQWVRGGYAQVQLRRLGRIWKRESLPGETVFNEARVLFSRFPPMEEELGSPEVMGAVLGVPTQTGAGANVSSRSNASPWEVKDL
jgi:hypothetical protein